MAVFRGWAQAAKALGIKRVEGGLIIDASCFSETTRLGEGWSWDYQSDYYAAPVGAFSFNENVVSVRVEPGNSAGRPCKVSLYPPVDCFVIRNETATSSKASSSLNVHREGDSNEIVVRGGLRLHAKSEYETVTVHDPSRYAGAALLAALEEKGVAVRDGVAVSSSAPKSGGGQAALVAEYVSPPLSEIIKEVNQSSNNHLAEMICLAAGRAASGAPASYEQSRAAERQFWSKMGLTDASRLYPADGSGLSRLNLFTPRSFCELLRRMQQHEEREAYVNSLAINGKSGTLASRLGREPYRQRVLGKTGHISNVSCLSGYLIDNAKRTLVFSILVNNFTCSTSSIKAAQDQMCEWLIDLPEMASDASGDSKTASAKSASPKAAAPKTTSSTAGGSKSSGSSKTSGSSKPTSSKKK